MSFVMVVDDDGDIRESLKDLLEDEGFRVATAVNGQDALDKLRSSPGKPCLVLLDSMMPVMSGQVFRQAQLSEQRLSSIPVVLTSADRNALQKVQDTPFDAFLPKPVELDLLLDLVKRHCPRLR